MMRLRTCAEIAFHSTSDVQKKCCDKQYVKVRQVYSFEIADVERKF